MKANEDTLLPACPIETTLTMISNKWKILIIRDLLDGTKRFGELKKSLEGISQKVLTENLRDMESKMLISRKVYLQIPPKVEYSLSETGKSLNPILKSMANWGQEYKQKA
ncbi:MAG: helix-turn-helix domain-containing protein [Opitutales bacterium]